MASFAVPAVDWRVVVFAVVIALAAGLLAGVLPMLRTTRGDFLSALRSGARGSSVGVGSLRRPTALSAVEMLWKRLVVFTVVEATGGDQEAANNAFWSCYNAFCNAT